MISILVFFARGKIISFFWQVGCLANLFLGPVTNPLSLEQNQEPQSMSQQQSVEFHFKTKSMVRQKRYLRALSTCPESYTLPQIYLTVFYLKSPKVGLTLH
jgi:hypothetical protein